MTTRLGLGTQDGDCASDVRGQAAWGSLGRYLFGIDSATARGSARPALPAARHAARVGECRRAAGPESGIRPMRRAGLAGHNGAVLGWPAMLPA